MPIIVPHDSLYNRHDRSNFEVRDGIHCPQKRTMVRRITASLSQIFCASSGVIYTFHTYDKGLALDATPVRYLDDATQSLFRDADERLYGRKPDARTVGSYDSNTKDGVDIFTGFKKAIHGRLIERQLGDSEIIEQYTDSFLIVQRGEGARAPKVILVSDIGMSEAAMFKAAQIRLYGPDRRP